MKKPAIADLSPQERQAIINALRALEFSYKDTAIEAIRFIDELIEELKTSKINTKKLSRLLGFSSEKIKELMRTR